MKECLRPPGKKQCEEKFKQELLGVWKDAAEYKIKTYDDFAYKLRMLNERYVDEMEDFDDFPSDLNPCTITYYKEAEERGDSVVEATYMILRIFDVEKKLVFTNEKGQPCDENGVLLSGDLEHRVFEVIKGGKHDDQPKPGSSNTPCQRYFP